MHAFLITGGSYENRKKKEGALCSQWNVAPFDIFRLDIGQEKRSVGIAEIRLLTQNLSFAPQKSPVVVGIIDQAQCLTTEAQNALLKTLEEPPPKARIILETDHAYRLLLTVVSRCHIIHLSDRLVISASEEEKIMTVMQSFSGKNPGTILQLVDRSFPSQEDGEQFLTALLHILHAHLLASQKNSHLRVKNALPASLIAYKIRAVLKAQKQLAAHVRRAMVFDTFFRTIALYNPHKLVYN